MDNYVFVNLNFILSQGEKIILIFDSQYIPLPLGIVFTPNTWSFWILAESEMLYSVKSYLTRLKFQCLSLLHELLCRHSALSLQQVIFARFFGMLPCLALVQGAVVNPYIYFFPSSLPTNIYTLSFFSVLFTINSSLMSKLCLITQQNSLFA